MPFRTLSVLVGLVAVGCSGVQRPDLFLLPENRVTWEEGERLVGQGERKIAEGRELREKALPAP